MFDLKNVRNSSEKVNCTVHFQIQLSKLQFVTVSVVLQYIYLTRSHPNTLTTVLHGGKESQLLLPCF